MKRILVRLLWSSVIALISWIGATGALIEWLLPPTTPGEEDLGAGLVAAAIFLAALQVSLAALAAFNVLAWRRDRRFARESRLN